MREKTKQTETPKICAQAADGLVEQAIYDYVYATFGKTEAEDPSWYIPDLAKYVSDALKNPHYEPKHRIRYETN